MATRLTEDSSSVRHALILRPAPRNGAGQFLVSYDINPIRRPTRTCRAPGRGDG